MAEERQRYTPGEECGGPNEEYSKEVVYITL